MTKYCNSEKRDLEISTISNIQVWSFGCLGLIASCTLVLPSPDHLHRDEWLPTGFKDRIEQKNTGLLIHGWAPQLKILSHGSTGAFLSHCGWNLILESMAHGVPIICWPLGGDQFYNSMMLVESGLAVELARGVTDSLLPTREKVDEVVNLVMGPSEKGMEIRRRTKECRFVMTKARHEEGGSSMKNLLEFVQSIYTASGNK